MLDFKSNQIKEILAKKYFPLVLFRGTAAVRSFYRPQKFQEYIFVNFSFGEQMFSIVRDDEWFFGRNTT